MIQRSVILLLMFVFVGCGEDEPEKVKPKEVVDEAPEEGIIWKKDGARMALIPAGSMVELDAFYMDIHEVTVQRFKKFVRETGYEYDHWDDVAEYSPTSKHPMIFVNLHEATAYCEWSGKRLPTETEWEFAARGGLVDKTFTWGDDEAVARDYANFYGVLGRDQWDETTAPVGSFKPNGYGLFDMAGNVWEFCRDWYDSNQIYRVLRGGSWNGSADDLRAASRFNIIPTGSSNNGRGFRCVLGLPKLDPSAQFKGNYKQ